MVETVHEYVPLTVNLTLVDTQTDRVLVLQVTRIIIVPQVNISQLIFISQNRFMAFNSKTVKGKQITNNKFFLFVLII